MQRPDVIPVPDKIIRGQAPAGIQFLGPRFCGDDGRSGLWVWSALLLLTLATVGCGFHLRGQGQAMLPPSLTQLRLVSPGADPNGALVTTLRQNLQAQPGITLVDDAAAPVVSLLKEQVDSQVLSVRTSTAKAAEYQLRYTVEFDVRDGAGQPLLARQVLRLTRDYTFDPVNVLAKEHEERELLRELARDAASQIVRRMSRIKRAN